jgi:hypothetical protein
MTTHEIDLENYETVKERKTRFYKDNPDGRIIVEQISLPEQILECSEFKSYIYKNASDQEKKLPWSTGHALELREINKSISRSGKEYESVNYTSWTENAEESAVGRGLDNAGYAGSPSREEMKKVIRHTQILNNKPYVPVKPTTPQLNLDDLTPEHFADVKEPLRDSMGKTTCVICGKQVSKKVEEFSMDKFGKVLCMDHQKAA